MSSLKLKVTGNCRDIANSAWISTTDEIKTKSRTDEDVSRVVSFLAQNMHTSPFECVTVTIECTLVDVNKDHRLNSYMINPFSKVTNIPTTNKILITTDLLNFAKISYLTCFDSSAWKLFEKDFSQLAEKVKLFDFSAKEEPNPEVSDSLFEDQMSVELIDFHDVEFRTHSRATWRIRCPLSIAVQILRHRTGSFNMVSGRYKTIRQEMIGIPDDINEIVNVVSKREQELDLEEFSHLDSLLEEMSYKMKSSKHKYLEIMKKLKWCKTKKIMKNTEYKRMREYVRFILPEGRMTELYVTFYMPDFENFTKLRNSSHAQIEHIWIAQKMKKTLENHIKSL